MVTDAITTQVVNSSAYFFNNTAQLIDCKCTRGAESTLFTSSGMAAITAMLSALVPAGGHIVTTTDCYMKTRIYIEEHLSNKEIMVTTIDPADVEALESELDNNKVSLFFTKSPTNPFLRCVDIKRVSELCHRKGALVCIDGSLATPLNQKALALGADLVLYSATKYIGGHNDLCKE
ncbi:cystathionine gamma-synthase 1, chloroplastic-like [Ziziphus jujuba]|uniref:Cystathionine gamma-synthase 1, chloroplastic-like n=1 Tax=Ziziphus jujuba TaxID=326968 RepID=A0ABM4A7W3_ZIZJJ|nr:cystathionine gamma-synthase 1, chloroplastic-like [Ziziphus jujuba]